MEENKPVGLIEGEICNRNGCLGIMQEIPSDGSCSCHIDPPCGFCTDKEYECSVCGAVDEGAKGYKEPLPKGYSYKGITIKWKTNEERYRELDHTKIGWVIVPYCNSAQICLGKCPPGTSKDEILKAGVEGTFGGRFESFNATKGLFKYIAYTD